MFVQILSDLHLESPKGYDIFEFPAKADHLALLGDIGNVKPHKDELLDFLKKQLARFRAALFVPGNHEAYGSNWTDTLDILRTFETEIRADKSLGEFVLLDRAKFEIPDTNVVILGCSLFSDVPPESDISVTFSLNDFWQIEDWSVANHNEAHRRNLEWLNSQVAELEERDVKIMVFTHWSPTKDARSIDPRHAESLISSGFSSNLSDQRCFKVPRSSCGLFAIRITTAISCWIERAMQKLDP